MIATLVVATVVGATAAVVALVLFDRHRQQAVHDVLDEFDGEAADHPEITRASVLTRVRRVVQRMSEGTEEAQRATERLELALDRVVEGIVLSDEEGRIVFTNAAGSILADARHEDSLVTAAVADCLRSAVAGEAASRSVELFGPPARTITVDAQPLGGDDGSSGAVARITDRSRLRRLEAVRSDFVANVSHELKTPVGGLALLAEALSDAGDPEERGRLAGRLLHEAHRVGRVVDDLLALSEAEGDLAARRERIAVDDLVARVRGEVAVLAEGHGVDVDTTGVAAGLWLEGDRVLMGSALGNLVENAVKYSGGASPVRVTALGDDREVVITVADRGIGIPRQDLDRVFERFYRVDRARSRATGGTGLGLALVRNIVQGHGGEVRLTSREGEGTTVVIRLPAAPSVTAEDGPSDAASTGVAGPGGQP